MLGAYTGDIVGSIYERENKKSKDFSLFTPRNRFTDDSVMTCAVGKACIEYSKTKDLNKFKEDCIKYMQYYGRRHINAGYGGTFIKWLLIYNPPPYNSFGNGSAMRVSPCGWVAESLEEAEKLAEVSASVSHNHPYGIQGAKAIASSIWMLRNGASKENVKEYIEKKYYPLDFTIDGIRKNYVFDVTCQGSVPQAIEAFLEGNDFEDCVRLAISIGGDSDTIGAMAGSLAESYYGVPDEIKEKTISYLDRDLKSCLDEFEQTVNKTEEKAPLKR